MIYPLMHEDRLELLVSAVAGAALGIAAAYLDRSSGVGLLIWTVVLAIVASGMVYCLRAFRW
jgi:hypothetical protein